MYVLLCACVYVCLYDYLHVCLSAYLPTVFNICFLNEGMHYAEMVIVVT